MASDLAMQARVLVSTFVVAALAASAVASQGRYFVQRKKETFAAARESDRAYEAWLEAPEPRPELVDRLVRADASLLARAERTLAVGSPAQRRRAVRFLLLAGTPEARPALLRARDWLARMGEDGLCSEIERGTATGKASP